jgi:hypothetical protein
MPTSLETSVEERMLTTVGTPTARTPGRLAAERTTLTGGLTAVQELAGTSGDANNREA